MEAALLKHNIDFTLHESWKWQVQLFFDTFFILHIQTLLTDPLETGGTVPDEKHIFSEKIPIKVQIVLMFSHGHIDNK